MNDPHLVQLFGFVEFLLLDKAYKKAACHVGLVVSTLQCYHAFEGGCYWFDVWVVYSNNKSLKA